jgi:nucleoside-diphosphate-sugar epimerase
LVAASVSAPRVLVTGARGFIGSHVVTALEARGADVSAFARPDDYHDAQTVERVFRKVSPSILVHCAWRLAPGSDYLGDPANSHEVVASLRLFRLAQAAGCARIVGVGTCLEYAGADGPVAETAPLQPRTLYGTSKAALFFASAAWAREADVSLAWARLYFPYGPAEAKHRLIPTVVNGLLRGERVATTAGTQRRSWIFAPDAGDAIAAIAMSDVDGPVNVGAEEVVAVRDVVERIADMLGRRDLLDIGAFPPRPDDPQVLWADIRKLTSSVKWKPTRDLNAGLEETIAWWQTQA